MVQGCGGCFAGALFLVIGADWFVVVYGGFERFGCSGLERGLLRGVLVLGFLGFGGALIWAGWAGFLGGFFVSFGLYLGGLPCGLVVGADFRLFLWLDGWLIGPVSRWFLRFGRISWLFSIRVGLV